MRYVTGYYIGDSEAAIVTVVDELENYYELLGCSTIEAPSITVDGYDFDVICDEEALCRGETPRCTVGVRIESGTCRRLIHGPCFVVKADEEGNWCSPTSDELMSLELALARDSEGKPILIAEGPSW